MSVTSKSESFIQNSYILMVGQLIAELISIIGTIVTIRLCTVQEFSLLNIAYTIPNILTLIGELGLNYASVHYIAKYQKENDEIAIRNVIRMTIKIKLIVTSTIGIICALMVGFLATVVYGVDDIELQNLMYISIIAAAGNIFTDVSLSYFIGLERMKIVRISQIMRTSIRAVLIILLFMIDIRPYGPMIAYAVAPCVTAVFNFIMVKMKIPNPKPKSDESHSGILSKMMRYGYPLSIVSIIIGLQTQIINYIFTSFDYYDAISYFNVAVNSSAIILVFTQSLTNSLFPFFSKLDWNKEDERETLRKDYKLSLTLSNAIILPVSVLFIVFGSEIFPLIFSSTYIIASNYIAIYLATFTLVSFGLISLPAFFNGQGKTLFVFFIELTKLITSIIFAVVFTIIFGPIGVIYGIFIGHCISVLLANVLFYIDYEKHIMFILKKSVYFFAFCYVLGFVIRMIFDLIANLSIFSNVLLEIILVALCMGLFVVIWYLAIRYLNLLSKEDFQLIIQTLQPIPILNKFIGIFVTLDSRIFKDKASAHEN